MALPKIPAEQLKQKGAESDVDSYIQTDGLNKFLLVRRTASHTSEPIDDPYWLVIDGID